MLTVAIVPRRFRNQAFCIVQFFSKNACHDKSIYKCLTILENILELYVTSKFNGITTHDSDLKYKLSEMRMRYTDQMETAPYR